MVGSEEFDEDGWVIRTKFSQGMEWGRQIERSRDRGASVRLRVCVCIYICMYVYECVIIAMVDCLVLSCGSSVSNL